MNFNEVWKYKGGVFSYGLCDLKVAIFYEFMSFNFNVI